MASGRSFVQTLLALALLGTAAGAQSFDVEPGPRGRRDLLGVKPGSGSASALACSDVRTATIRRPGQSVPVLFSGSAGQAVDLTLVKDPGSFAEDFPQARLTSPTGAEMGVLNGTTLERLILPESGEYRIDVTATGPGTFHLGRWCPPPVGPGTQLAFGDTETGELTRLGELDYFTFDGLPGDMLELALLTVEGFDSSTPRATLIAPSGAVVGMLDAGNLSPFTLTEAGQHQIRVRANTLTGLGSYALGLYGTSVLVGATPLVCGDTAQEALGVLGSVEFFTFDGVIDQTLDLNLVAVSGFLNARPVMEIFTPTGISLGRFSGDSLTTLTLSETGAHLIQVSSSKLGEPGTFALGLNCRPPAVGGTPLACGGSIAATIADPSEADYYTFAGTSGDTAELSLVATSGFPTSTPQLRVIAPSGADLGAFNASATTIPIALQETGTFVIRVAANTLAETGGYTLGLTCVAGPFPAVHLGGDSVSPGAISVSGEVDCFTFDATIGEVVELTLVQTGGGSSARGTLFSPTGTNLGAVSGLTAFTLLETGRYDVKVEAFDAVSLLDYSLSLERRKPREPLPVPLVCGLVHSGSIRLPAEQDYFTFDATAGDGIDLTLTVRSGFAGTNARLYLFSPTDVFLGTVLANSWLAPTLLETGTYVVRVVANNLIGTGAYNVGLFCRKPAAPVTADLACGDLVTSTISTAGEFDYYTFNATAGDAIDLTLTVNSGFAATNARIYLFSPSDVFLGTVLANSWISQVLPETGTYVVRTIANNLVATGEYNVGLFCRNPAAPVSEHLTSGEIAKKSISAPGEVDYFTFDGTAGDALDITLTVDSGFAATNALIYLFSPSNVFLSNQVANGWLTPVLPETGTYTLRVIANNLIGTGDYRVGLFRRNPTAPLTAGLDCGGLVTSTISEAAEVDYFTFEATAGDTVDVTLTVNSGFAATNAHIYLFSPTNVFLGNVLANSWISQTLPETGTYVVRAIANNLLGTGEYNVGVYCRNPPAPVTANLLCGDIATSTVSAPGEVDYFTFDATAGDAIDLTLTVNSGFAGTNAFMYLFTPSNGLVGQVAANSWISEVLPETGTYTVRAIALNLVSTGSYNVGLFCRNPTAPVTADLACGDLVTSTISAAGEVDYFTFDATAGDALDITLTVNSGFAGTNGRMYLFSPSNVFLGTVVANSWLTPTVTETGTYVVRVITDNLVGTGSYNVGLGCRNPASPVTANLLCGDISSSSISAPGEMDYFTFDATAGDAIDLTLTVESGFAGSNAFLYLFSPSNTLVGQTAANNWLQPVLTETGTYTARVIALNLISTGNYRVGLFCRNPTAPVVADLSCGDTVASSISTAGEVDYFTFDGTAGQMITLSITHLSGFAGTAARVYLFSPSNALLGSFNANNSSGFTLLESGTFVIRVIALNLVADGNYEVGVTCP